MCTYEDINTAFACIAMDMKNLKYYADNPEKVLEIEKRIKTNIETGQKAVRLLGEQTKAIQEILLAIYPVNIGSNLEHYLQGRKDEKDISG